MLEKENLLCNNGLNPSDWHCIITVGKDTTQSNYGYKHGYYGKMDRIPFFKVSSFPESVKYTVYPSLFYDDDRESLLYLKAIDKNNNDFETCKISLTLSNGFFYNKDKKLFSCEYGSLYTPNFYNPQVGFFENEGKQIGVRFDPPPQRISRPKYINSNLNCFC